ncbi:heterogeneous nuclear ribonucleoprotein Q-like isoform X2 [Telopea speciosissima]|uniref:heterogeneous nuclear ribonucleoprotein Q-like isoform X2 n=1 Tax=Telopea speciosissima TaxID=54955 RepID=UPI001CC3D4B0|nr:heterogeneous nuclear ribonucleoprotein Q-like isoform X2 [Telopea speciosissima]
MPPRAVKKPSTVTALKKKTPVKTPVETKEEPKEAEALQNNTNKSTVSTNYEEHREPSPTPKEEKEGKDIPIGYHEVDRSERLELEDNYPNSEAEEYGGAHVRMEGEEEHYEERIDGDYMMEGEGEEDGHAEEIDGEEEEEHHDVAKERQERRKRKQFEIFVGGLDRDATEEDLTKVFSQVGEVTEVRLMKNPVTHKNKGFAFLRFATVEQARRAINELKHPTVSGKQCGVAPSQDNDTLFVGNICKTWTKEALKEKLAQYGVDNFEDLTLVKDTRNEGMNRGFAFLDFPSRAVALDACKLLQRRDVVFGTDRTAKVSFADTSIEPDDEIMSQVKTIFIDGLPAAWDEDRVKEYLEKYGKIEKVELARNMPAAKRTDFGFITFDTHDSAMACVEGINDLELGDGDKKVKVRARLSRPRQRGRIAKHARGGYLVGHSGSRGGNAPWSSSMPLTDSWRYAGRSDRVTQSRSSYGGGYKQPLGPRDRHPQVDVISDRVGGRRRVLSPRRSYDQMSPGPAYGKSSSRRDYVRHDEPFPRSSDYTSARPGRRSSYRDSYPYSGPGYPDSPPRSTSRGAARRPPPLYAEESYERPMERPSTYRDSHSRDYPSLSGSKRPHSASELHPRYAESTIRQSQARYEYGRGSDAMPYDDDDDAYGNESTRVGRGSHLGYEGGGRSSAGHSYGLYDSRTSSVGYSRDEASRGDAGGMYSSYGRDYMSRGYMSPGEDVGADSYSSAYSSRRMSDGYLSGRGSGSYY